MIRAIAMTGIVAVTPFTATAHKLIVFASVECDAVTVEAKFPSGKMAHKGEVRVYDSENAPLTTLPLGSGGTLRIPLSGLEHTQGLVIEVDTGGHDNYWIVTPEDIARKCRS